VIGSSSSSVPAGICITSAVAIHATCPSQISERAIQRSIEHLAKIGWIKRWNVAGKRGNYPVLVCRGSVHDLSGNEFRVSGVATVDWRQPKYVRVGDLSVIREVADELLSGDREVEKARVEKGERTKSKSAAAPRTAPPFHPFAEIWNLYKGSSLPEVKSLSRSRMVKCQARAKNITEDEFRTIVQAAASTPFCRGENNRGWKVTFDWLIENDANALKVREGNYAANGNRGNHHGHDHSVTDSAAAEVRRRLN
jgi:hypothetical protein